MSPFLINRITERRLRRRQATTSTREEIDYLQSRDEEVGPIVDRKQPALRMLFESQIKNVLWNAPMNTNVLWWEFSPLKKNANGGRSVLFISSEMNNNINIK